MFHQFVLKGVACYKKCFKEHSIRECAYNESVYDEAVVRGEGERDRDRQTDRERERQRQTDRERERETDRQTGREL